MTLTQTRRRIALAGVLAVTAIGSAAPAQAAGAGDQLERCDTQLERINDQFRHLEEKRGWYEAAEWWDHAWASYYKRCLAP